MVSRKFLVVVVFSVLVGCGSVQKVNNLGIGELVNGLEKVETVESEVVGSSLELRNVAGVSDEIKMRDINDHLVSVEVDGKYELHEVLKMVLGSFGYAVSSAMPGMVDVYVVGDFSESDLFGVCKGICESLGYTLRVDGKICTVVKVLNVGDMVESVKVYKSKYVQYKRDDLAEFAGKEGDIKLIVMGNYVVVAGRKLSVDKMVMVLSSMDVDVLKGRFVKFVSCYDADKVVSSLEGVYDVEGVKVKKIRVDMVAIVSTSRQYLDYTTRMVTNISRSVGQSPIYVYKTRYRSVDEVKKYVDMLDEVEMVIDNELSAIYFKCSYDKYQVLKKSVELFDVLPKQVLMRLYMLDVRSSKEVSFGMDYSVDAGDLQIDKSMFSLNIIGGLSGVYDINGVKAFFRMLEKVLDARVISKPSVYMKSGQESEIKFTTSVPVLTSKGSGQSVGVGAGIIQQVEYRDVGIIFRVLPVCSGNNILIDVYVENSALQRETGVEGNPLFMKDSVRSKFIVKDGSFCVLGGLKFDNNELSNTGIPFIRRIKYLGYLFGGEKRTNEKREMLICLFPKIVRSEYESDRLSESLLDSLKLNFN